jgi:hypothetical protein
MVKACVEAMTEFVNGSLKKGDGGHLQPVAVPV